MEIRIGSTADRSNVNARIMQKCLILFSILIALLIFVSLTGNNEANIEQNTVIVNNDSIDGLLKGDIKEIDKILVNK